MVKIESPFLYNHLSLHIVIYILGTVAFPDSKDFFFFLWSAYLCYIKNRLVNNVNGKHTNEMVKTAAPPRKS